MTSPRAASKHVPNVLGTAASPFSATPEPPLLQAESQAPPRDTVVPPLQASPVPAVALAATSSGGASHGLPTDRGPELATPAGLASTSKASTFACNDVQELTSRASNCCVASFKRFAAASSEARRSATSASSALRSCSPSASCDARSSLQRRSNCSQDRVRSLASASTLVQTQSVRFWSAAESSTWLRATCSFAARSWHVSLLKDCLATKTSRERKPICSRTLAHWSCGNSAWFSGGSGFKSHSKMGTFAPPASPTNCSTSRSISGSSFIPAYKVSNGPGMPTR
mmetsp:Transcript_786/g.1732  ORF Transcript_786/g.1732 Transcript_786/m.1732 type:complete len:284 (-) Transcript_786:28-879(-)